MGQVQKIRAVVAKPGLDGHDRGAKVVARGLRDAGFEVIYTGLHQTPQDILNTVIQEDPNVLLLSILSGHTTICCRITKLMKANNINDVLVSGGGIIPDDDVPFLERTEFLKYSVLARLYKRWDYIKSSFKIIFYWSLNWNGVKSKWNSRSMKNWCLDSKRFRMIVRVQG